MQQSKLQKRIRRHTRVRAKITGTATQPRLAVFRSNRYIYAQIIDDSVAKTIVAGSDQAVASKAKVSKEPFAKVKRAEDLGQEMAKAAKAKGINKVVFDRGGYRFTGRVKAVADGARAGGLEF